MGQKPGLHELPGAAEAGNALAADQLFAALYCELHGKPNTPSAAAAARSH